jgi:hypothetical protein
MARVKAKKRKVAKECVQNKKADKIRPILYIGEGFQNRAFWDLRSHLEANRPRGRDQKSWKALF